MSSPTPALPTSFYGVGHTPASEPPERIGLPAQTRATRAVKIEVDYEIRCQGSVAIRTRPGEEKKCGKLLIEHAGRPWQVKCSRCGTTNRSSAPGTPPGL